MKIEAIKDILLEQWNDCELTDVELLKQYEVAVGRPLNEKETSSFLKMLSDWNNFGIQEFVKLEKSILEKSGLNYAECENFLEQFISERLR